MIGPLIYGLDLHTSGGEGVVTTGGFLQLPSVNFPTPLSMLPKKSINKKLLKKCKQTTDKM